MVESKFLEEDKIDGITRKWYELNGEDFGTGYVFEQSEYAVCSDGSILNEDGCGLDCESDYETIAVRSSIQ